MMIRFDDKEPGDEITIEIDFADVNPTGAALTVPTIEIETFSGADPDPAAMLVGSPTVIDSRVLQRLAAGLAGCDYAIKVSVQIGNDRTTEIALLPVRDRPEDIAETPRYLTEAEFEQRFGEGELANLLRAGHSFTRAENDASGVVDGYLSSRYTLPLVSVPLMVKRWVADIARFNLWENQAPEEVRKRYEDALAQLKELAKGLINLPPGSDGETPAEEGGQIDSFAACRVMTMDSLKGF